jgi:hypothetical protein
MSRLGSLQVGLVAAIVCLGLAGRALAEPPQPPPIAEPSTEEDIRT